MNHDGTKDGFAIDITRAVSESVNVPVIASGGAGKMAHFTTVFNEGKQMLPLPPVFSTMARYQYHN